MSEKKRTAVHETLGELEILAGPVELRAYNSDEMRPSYWAVDVSNVGLVVPASKLTFPPKAEDFENVYPIGGFISGRHRTKGGADISASSGRIAVLHRWQDQDGQWHAELLNDE